LFFGVYKGLEIECDKIELEINKTDELVAIFSAG
jgi:hypothetical protein